MLDSIPDLKLQLEKYISTVKSQQPSQDHVIEIPDKSAPQQAQEDDNIQLGVKLAEVPSGTL